MQDTPNSAEAPFAREFRPADYFGTVTPQDIFGNDNPMEVDLGCGDGTFLLEMAEQYPERNFLGVERLLGRVRKVCKKAERRGLTNVKVLRLESKYVVEWLLAPNSVSRLHLLCPDPWPKARHHRRRLVQHDFLEALVRVLKPGSEFCFKTDHPGYYEWAEEELRIYPKFEQLPWAEDEFFYPKTDFQKQWEAEGKEIFRIRSKSPESPALRKETS